VSSRWISFIVRVRSPRGDLVEEDKEP